MTTFFEKSLVILATLGTVAVGSELLPPQAQPLSKVLASLEQQGLAPIVEVDFDDGVWEIEGFRNGQAVELRVDPISGKTLQEHADHFADRPSADAKPASTIVKILEDQGYSPILELDWKRTSWQVEAVGPSGKRELQIAPGTGEILSDLADR